MKLVYLLLGSNVGNREGNIHAAMELISQHAGPVTQKSAIYETEPWGGVEQGAFLNQAIALETSLDPEALLAQLKSIEKAVGRVETVMWGPRVIDIDIMLISDTIYNTEHLVIPQRRLEHRRFALAPLAEIAPQAIHPVLNATIQQLLIDCDDSTWVKMWTADLND